MFRYFRHHVEANPLLAKWYIDKAAHRAGTGPSPGCKPRAKSLFRLQVTARIQHNPRTVNCMSEVHPDTDSKDTLKEDAVPKKD